MNKDRKAFLKNAAAFGIVIGLWFLFALMTVDIAKLPERLAAAVFVTLIALLTADAMEKAFYDLKNLNSILSTSDSICNFI